ncbi:MAG: hypothetical protein GXO78_08185 [Calditrichaeota bacterium]|nr:hypothetical protein [Calditrichota bacterium]
MKRKNWIWMGLLIAGLLHTALFAEQPKQQIHLIAFIEYEGPKEYATYGKRIKPQLHEQLSHFENINFVERDLKDVMSEITLSQTGLTQREFEIGKILNADYTLHINVSVEFLDEMFKVRDYTFTIEGKWTDIRTSKMKSISESGKFDDAADESNHPFTLAITNFIYKLIDVIIQDVEIQEDDFRSFIESEEETYKSIRFRGYRNAAFWFLAGAASGWYGNKLQRDGKAWYLYGSMYVVSGALIYASVDNVLISRNILNKMGKRIQQHKEFFRRKFNKPF